MRQAAELGALLRRHDLMSHVNLIPWNAVDGSPYERPSNNAVHRFADALRRDHRIPTSIRVTRGASGFVPHCGSSTAVLLAQSFSVPQSAVAVQSRYQCPASGSCCIAVFSLLQSRRSWLFDGIGYFDGSDLHLVPVDGIACSASEL